MRTNVPTEEKSIHVGNRPPNPERYMELRACEEGIVDTHFSAKTFGYSLSDQAEPQSVYRGQSETN